MAPPTHRSKSCECRCRLQCLLQCPCSLNTTTHTARAACTPMHTPLPPPLLQIKKLQESADGHKAAATEFSRSLDALTRSPSATAVQQELGDTVRRMAVVQVRARTRPSTRVRVRLC